MMRHGRKRQRGHRKKLRRGQGLQGQGPDRAGQSGSVIGQTARISTSSCCNDSRSRNH